jgi:hypothetical protein
MHLLDQAKAGMTQSLQETWGWFNKLQQDEWVALLAVVACLGFLCMRGFNTRGTL